MFACFCVGHTLLLYYSLDQRSAKNVTFANELIVNTIAKTDHLRTVR